MNNILDILNPFHLRIDAQGRIVHCGPSLDKINGGLGGELFVDRFVVQRPSRILQWGDMAPLAGKRLQLMARHCDLPVLRGVFAPDGAGGGVVDLCFGIGVVDAVRSHHLTNADFAPTDLTVDLLYLIEAKSAAMNASRNLTKRLQVAHSSAEEQAMSDTLTGLRNRRALDLVLARLIAAGRPFSIMHVDLDFFKAVNDTYGHAAGDAVLRCVAQRLINETRDGDTVARLGGDEFTLVFTDLIDENRLSDVAARLIEALEEPIPYGAATCCISASIGIASSTSVPSITQEHLLAAADRALYGSKNAGRCRFTHAAYPIAAEA